MSQIGREIGDFTVQAYQNEDFKTVTKADALGHWSLFFFYPADFTFVCPTELEELAENYDAFKAEGCEVYSVSCDTHFVHKAWHDEIEPDGLAERGAFIVDPEGKVQVYEVTAGGIGRNAKELLRLLQAAKFVAEHGDQVCPATWQPGAETLKPSLDLVGQL